MEFNTALLEWINEPKEYSIKDNRIEITTEPGTDLWQRTYYKFRNDNAPMLQMQTDEKEFSFSVKTNFNSNNNFDQSGIILYLNSENWIKASVEYGNEKDAFLGSVVTNRGYSDWSTTRISNNIKELWFRLSRRGNDFCVEVSYDGVIFEHIRICHLFEANDIINFGIYACSPENGAFKATFTDFELGECKWALHTGQQPDEDFA